MTQGEISEKVLNAIQKLSQPKIDPKSFLPVMQGKYMALFTVGTDTGPASIQVRMHQSSMQISLDSPVSHISLAI